MTSGGPFRGDADPLRTGDSGAPSADRPENRTTIGVPRLRPDLFVYLSGPMTARDGFLAEENVAAGLRVHLDLLRLGVANFCPHLVGGFPSAWANVPYDRWLAYDLAVIDRCTHVLLLPRWETSTGARIEKTYAESRGLPILVGIPAEWR